MVRNLKIITNESGETRNKVIFIKHMYHVKAHFMLSIYSKCHVWYVYICYVHTKHGIQNKCLT